MIITTYTQLENILNGKCQEALDRTTDRLLDKLGEFIQNDVYGAYSPTFYDRTFDFKNSWEKTSAKLKGRIVEAEIFQNINTLAFNSDKFQHGSNVWVEAWNDNKNELAHIINDGAIGEAFGFPQLGARPFWNDFIQYCEREFENIFQEELKKII